MDRRFRHAIEVPIRETGPSLFKTNILNRLLQADIPLMKFPPRTLNDLGRCPPDLKFHLFVIEMHQECCSWNQKKEKKHEKRLPQKMERSCGRCLFI
jgi:hypothetical protein